MKLNAIAAAVALAVVSVNANAAFDATAASPNSNDVTSVILSVIDDGPTDRSIAIDLGMTGDDLLYNTGTFLGSNLLAGVSSDALTQLSNIVSNPNGTIRWDVTSIVNRNFDVAPDLGVLQTYSSLASFVPTNIENMALNQQAQWITNDLAAGALGNDWVIDDPTDTNNGHLNINHAAKNSGSWNSETGLGDSMTFAFFSEGEFESFYPPGVAFAPGVFDLGEMTLALNGGVAELQFASATAPIPLPAGAWLFGTAILGLAGVARRRAA